MNVKIIAISVASALALGGAGYAGYKKWGKTDEAAKKEEKPAGEAKVTITPTEKKDAAKNGTIEEAKGLVDKVLDDVKAMTTRSASQASKLAEDAKAEAAEAKAAAAEAKEAIKEAKASAEAALAEAKQATAEAKAAAAAATEAGKEATLAASTAKEVAQALAAVAESVRRIESVVVKPARKDKAPEAAKETVDASSPPKEPEASAAGSAAAA